MSFSCVMAVSLMPIGDLVVIAFSSSIVFSLMLECLILKRPLTVLATIICILIVLGDVLVVQPPFIFTSMSVNHEVNDTNLSSMTTTATDLTNSSVIVTKTVEEAETVMASQSGQ